MGFSGIEWIEPIKTLRDEVGCYETVPHFPTSSSGKMMFLTMEIHCRLLRQTQFCLIHQCRLGNIINPHKHNQSMNPKNQIKTNKSSPTNQINQPVSPSLNQSNNQTNCQSIYPSIYMYVYIYIYTYISINLSITQPVNQIDRSINQSNRSIDRSIVQPTNQPPNQSTNFQQSRCYSWNTSSVHVSEQPKGWDWSPDFVH